MDPREEVFSNYILFLKIVENLDLDELKKCRLVSKRWRDEITKLVLRRQNFCLNILHNKFEVDRFGWDIMNDRWNSIEESTGSEEYFVFAPRILMGDGGKLVNYSKESLNALSLLVRKSYKFPCNYLRISCGNLKDPMLQDFLRLFGPFVKRLEFLRCNGKKRITANERHADGRTAIDCEDFRNMILHQLVNLEHLELSPCEHHFSQFIDENKLFRLFMEDCWLPNIGKLVLPSYAMPADVLKYMIKACTLMTELVFYINLENVKTAGEANRLKNVYHLDLNPTRASIDGWEYLIANGARQMRVCSIDVFGSLFDSSSNNADVVLRAREVLYSLLTIFSLQLVTLTCFDYSHLTENLRVVLPVVKHLTLKESDSVVRMAVQQFNDSYLHLPNQERVARTYQLVPLNDIFPSLVSLTLSLVPGDKALDDIFGNSALPHLRRLVILQTQLVPVIWFQRMITLCPNVTYLELHKIRRFNEISRHIWKMPSIRYLQLVFSINQYTKASREVDSAFTGFSERVCSLIAEGSHMVDPRNTNLRDYPSIIDAEKLQNLVIEVVPTCNERNNRFPLVVSDVAGKYAFKECPKLKVILSVAKEERSICEKLPDDWRDSLSSVLPYVTSYL